MGLTLEEVNENRKEHGLQPLRSLPAERVTKYDIIISKRRERAKDKLLDYLSNPDNKPVESRKEYLKIINIKSAVTFLKMFSSEELTKLEAKALELRRLQYSNRMALIDDGLLEKAAEGKAPEAKLAYQRFEGWTEKTVTEVTNTLTLTLDAELQAMLNTGRGAIPVDAECETTLLPERI